MLKFFVVKDHLWDGNSLPQLQLVPLEDLEGLSTQRVWHSVSQRGDRVKSAKRSRTIHYKINDDVCGFHLLRDVTRSIYFPSKSVLIAAHVLPYRLRKHGRNFDSLALPQMEGLAMALFRETTARTFTTIILTLTL